MSEQGPYERGPTQQASPPGAAASAAPPPGAAPPWPPYPGQYLTRYPGYYSAPPGTAMAAAVVPARSYAWIWGLAGSLILMAVLVVGGGLWTLTSGPQSYGDDPHLDSLWDACERGILGACDRLYNQSPLFSDYEEFGFTCGGRTDGEFACAPRQRP